MDPETGQTAALSLFWDLVFKPVYSAYYIGPAHTYFNSRQEAAVWEDVLQPIEEWGNGRLCLPTDGCCEDSSNALRLQMTVAAGFWGTEGDVSHAASPRQVVCTGDPSIAAFSRYGSTPNTIQLNVMSYGYKMADGSSAPDGTVEMTFLSDSQLEQIDRVLRHDVETKYFPGGSGMRPKLGVCADCHELFGS